MARGPTKTGITGGPTQTGMRGGAGAEASRSEMVLYAKIFDKGKVYLGPRKDDAEPSASFHYGDGSYVIQFHYTKSDKAAEKGGRSSSSTTPEDKKDKQYLGNREPSIDGGGSIVTGD